MKDRVKALKRLEGHWVTKSPFCNPKEILF